MAKRRKKRPLGLLADLEAAGAVTTPEQLLADLEAAGALTTREQLLADLEAAGELFGLPAVDPGATDNLSCKTAVVTKKKSWTETLREVARANFTQGELARQVGISQAAVSKFYNGGGLSLDVAEKIGRRFGFELLPAPGGALVIGSVVRPARSTTW